MRESKKFNMFFEKYLKSNSLERDELWNRTNLPFIEPSNEDAQKYLVTFLYRFNDNDITNHSKIYLYSSISGFPIDKKNEFKFIPGSDLCILTLLLPNTLMTSYQFIKIDNTVQFPDQLQTDLISNAPFVEISEFASENRKIHHLNEVGKIEIDSRNQNQISYPIDIDNPDKIFAKESILTLPNAPSSPYLPKDHH